MEILSVKDEKSRRMFLDVVERIYKDDDSYIRPLDVQIEEIFDPSANDYFSHGEAERFVLIDDDGLPAGRVAVFINRKKAWNYSQPTGGFGFFESIEDKSVAFSLFNRAKEWLSKRGMEAMDGPINFGENDTFWGLLVEGFTPPAFGMNYNPPYYKDFFEEYGFGEYYEQLTNHLNLQKKFPERFWRVAERVISREGYSFTHFKKSESEKFVKDFVEIYNEAWQYHEGFAPMDGDTLRKTLRETASFMEEELIWFAYYRDEPIGFIVLFPDINMIIRHFNGKFNLFNKLRFLYYKWRKEMSRARVVILGVKTSFQRLGIESGILYHLNNAVAKKAYLKEVELSWVGDFNPKMRALLRATEADFGKRHITYRYLFNSKGEGVKRAASIPVDVKQ
ncbi:GNAT family N-acetyltransferase [Marinilabiliaceae bacterium ANBcel2]|nr:GNAT family N-acetyltransferase [Marinilabiliaceae bacterium ANBcel2]